jgi:hypothetical protein
LLLCRSFALRDEFELGRLISGSEERLPSVKALEQHYGPRVRAGDKCSGSSYRSRHNRGNSQRVDNDFAKRRPFYDILIAEGEAGFLRLSELIAGEFGTAPPAWSQVSWLLTQLKIAKPEYATRKARGEEGAAKSVKRRKAGALLP